jgi:hypothetical protein
MHAILLAVAGSLSGWLTMSPALGNPAGAIAAGLLGLVLAAYLWWHAGVRSEARLAGVALIPFISHVGTVGLAIFTLALLSAFGHHPDTTGGLVAAWTGAVSAAIIAAIFLAAVPDQHDSSPGEIAFCGTAGALACFFSNFSEFINGVTILKMPLWNGGVAAALAFVMHVRSRPLARRTAMFSRLTGAGLVVVCVLMVFGGTQFVAAPEPVYLREMRERQSALLREARITSLNEAPPFADLAANTIVPARDVFTWAPTVGVVCNSPTGERLTPQTRTIESRQLRVPARHTYRLQCQAVTLGTNTDSTVQVEVIQYPNDSWAQYELRFQGGDQGLWDAIDVTTVTTASSNGRPVFVTGSTKALWSSGDKAIVVSGTAVPEVLDAFINGYLERYPNTLAADFDLPSLPPR